MNKKVFSVLATCCLTVIGATSARAQLPGTEIHASIPFDFSVQGRTLPSGHYEIRRIGDTPQVLLISGVTNHDHAVFNTEPTYAMRTSSKAEIIFHRYGDSYFLSEVIGSGEQTGRELSESRQERILKREMAASNDKRNQPETVALAAY